MNYKKETSDKIYQKILPQDVITKTINTDFFLIFGNYTYYIFVFQRIISPILGSET